MKRKFLLINKYDEIVDTVDLAGNVGKTGAKTYFKGVKRLPDDDDFDKLWKVMSEREYEMHFKNSLQNRQMGNMKYEWWKEDKEIIDDELKL